MQIDWHVHPPVLGSHAHDEVAHWLQFGMFTHAVKHPSGAGAGQPGAEHTFAKQPASSGAQPGLPDRAPG